MATSPREYRRILLELLPEQGAVREDEYLWLTDRARRAIEFSDGSFAARGASRKDARTARPVCDDTGRAPIGPPSAMGG